MNAAPDPDEAPEAMVRLEIQTTLMGAIPQHLVSWRKRTYFCSITLQEIGATYMVRPMEPSRWMQLGFTDKSVWLRVKGTEMKLSKLQEDLRPKDTKPLNSDHTYLQNWPVEILTT